MPVIVLATDSLNAIEMFSSTLHSATEMPINSCTAAKYSAVGPFVGMDVGYIVLGVAVGSPGNGVG